MTAESVAALLLAILCLITGVVGIYAAVSERWWFGGVMGPVALGFAVRYLKQYQRSRRSP
jgi:uncharacterized membrane protein (UPF0136 family)